jgi:hypothetical protein
MAIGISILYRYQTQKESPPEKAGSLFLLALKPIYFFTTIYTSRTR